MIADYYMWPMPPPSKQLKQYYRKSPMGAKVGSCTHMVPCGAYVTRLLMRALWHRGSIRNQIRTCARQVVPYGP